MISYECKTRIEIGDGNMGILANLSFKGLSGDTKPTGAYENMMIENGSTFYEMNTGKLYMYDAQNTTWIEQ